MAKIWAASASGDFTTASNWRPAAEPGATDNLVVDKSGPYTVTFKPGGSGYIYGDVTINSLRIDQPDASAITFAVTERKLIVSQKLINDGTVVASNLGTLAVGGDVVNHGTLKAAFQSGSISVAGDVRNGGSVIAEHGSFNLQGAVSNTGAIRVGGASPGTGTIGGAVINRVDASDPLDVKTGTISVTRSGSTLDILGRVVNYGTLSASGGDFSHGSVHEYGGTLNLHDGLVNHGAVNVTFVSKLVVEDTFVNKGMLTGAVASTITLGRVVNSGSIVGSGNSTGSPAVTITASADVFNSGTIDLTGGSSFTIAGNLINSDSATATGATFIFGPNIPVGSLLEVEGAVRNSGTLKAESQGRLHFEGAVTNLDGGLILADQSGKVTIDGIVYNQDGGIIEAGQSSTVEMNAAVRNYGDLIADNGLILVDGALTGAGDAMIQGSGIIDLAASANAHVSFSGAAAGELILRDTPHFQGDITGFADTDMIAFMDFLIGSTSVQYTANAGNTGGTLTLTDTSAPGHHASLDFVGAYDASEFVASDDGSGHVLVQHQSV
jgi:hypothetical protein